jgi:hypothetical protein
MFRLQARLTEIGAFPLRPAGRASRLLLRVTFPEAHFQTMALTLPSVSNRLSQFVNSSLAGTYSAFELV